jgi:molecular chaperone DnaJ
MSTDLYAILGVSRDASADEIRRAYRRLARELHPDVNGDPRAEERFKQITGAYEILSDPEKRQRYDTFGHTTGAAGSPFGDIQDIFDMFFGGGFGVGTRARRGPRRAVRQRGDDVLEQVTLSLHDAAFGVKRDVDVDHLVTCSRCAGTGAEPGTSPMGCRTCGGTGELQQVRQSLFGTVMTSTTCHICGGTGREIIDPCEECLGKGRLPGAETVTIDIPPGVDDGTDLRVDGRGHAGIGGGPAGDLYVRIRVEPSLEFDRHGRDLVSSMEVPFTVAALGGDIEVATLDGPERIRIDPGTRPGAVIRLRGKGVPMIGARGRGDLFISVQVGVPAKLSKEERTLVERLAEARGERSSKREPLPGELRRPER